MPKHFPEKESEAIYKRIAYKVTYLGKLELYKFHCFKDTGKTCLVCILREGTGQQIANFANSYGYELRPGSQLPEVWESTH